MPPVVTLTTDFGHADSFVGAMKGVLLTRCPQVQIVDITHEVPPQNVRVGALRLASAAPYFPPGTVHLAVVDPGVGGPRRAIAVACGPHFFVGPDNGVLSIATASTGPDWRAVQLTNPTIWRPEVSHTFHGRDIFAPAAADLARGIPLSKLGTPTDSIVELALARCSADGTKVRGMVLDVDRFGNLVSNIRETDLEGRAVDMVRVADVPIDGLSTWYDPSRALLALINSDGWLEIAAPGGNAAALLAAGTDTSVEVSLAPEMAS